MYFNYIKEFSIKPVVPVDLPFLGSAVINYKELNVVVDVADDIHLKMVHDLWLGLVMLTVYAPRLAGSLHSPILPTVLQNPS